MKNNIDYRNWTEGGTMLTNFGAKDYPIFRKAMRKYHKKYNTKRLFVAKKAFYNMGQIELENHYSLHSIKRGDLSSFWRIYDKIKESIK